MVAGYKALPPLNAALTPLLPHTHSMIPSRRRATPPLRFVGESPKGPRRTARRENTFKGPPNLLLHTTHPPHTHPTSIFARVWRHLYLKSTVVSKQIWNIHLITLQGRYCTPLDLMIHFVCNKTGFFAYSTQRTAPLHATHMRIGLTFNTHVPNSVPHPTASTS